jgi:hypothetical protein
MTNEYFIPYREVISKSISSCINSEQLLCCWDMIQQFQRVFEHVSDVTSVSGELTGEYEQKQAQLTIN